VTSVTEAVTSVTPCASLWRTSHMVWRTSHHSPTFWAPVTPQRLEDTLRDVGPYVHARWRLFFLGSRHDLTTPI
jgi:hypothetical protein